MSSMLKSAVTVSVNRNVYYTELQTVGLQYWRPSDFLVGQISYHRNNPVGRGTEEQRNG